MTIDAARAGGSKGNAWRIAGWGMAALVLLTPAVAMQYTEEVNWTASDFVFAGVLVGGVGLLFELTVRSTRNRAQRAGTALALAAAFLTLWANGAVGIIGSEENPYNTFFTIVVALALAGAIGAGFRAAGMARAMAVAAVAQALAGAGGIAADPRGGVYAIGFAGIWLVSAALFRKAAREES